MMSTEKYKNYETIEVHGQKHVVREIGDRGAFLGEKNDNANYRGTGKALVGILHKGDTLKEFVRAINNK